MASSNSPNFSGVRKRNCGEYVAEKWDPMTKKPIWLGTFNSAEEAIEAYLARQREFASDRHMFGEIPSSNLTNKTSSATAAPAERSKGYTFNTAEEGSEAYLKKHCEFDSAHHMFDKMPCSNSITKTAASTAAAESSKGGMFNTAEEVSAAYLMKHCEFGSAHQVFDAMPSSNLANKTAATAAAEWTKADNGKTPFIKEISFRDKSALLGAEWHNMGKLKKKDPFKKRKVCKSFNSNLHESKKPVKVMNQEKEPIICVDSDRCNTVKKRRKAKAGLLGIRSLRNGKYGAEIRDSIKQKPVWLGNFDTIEKASQAYLSKKCEFDMLSQGNKENEPKKCDQIQPESSVGASLFVANDQNLHAANVGRSKSIDCPKRTRIVGVRKNKWGKYTSEIIDPISKKKIWLGTFSTYEEASKAYRSKKLEFQKLVKPKKKFNREKQVGKEKLLNVKQGNVNCEGFQPESAVKFDIQISKEAKVQGKMLADFSTLEKQGGQEDANLWMGQWVQLSDGREVKFSLELGLPIIDKYGSLLGEFSSLDDLRIYDESIY
ncbi:unnamed protein product [Withania somnifera]